MSELAENLRELVIRALDLWSNANAQLAYQRAMPQLNLSNELFNKWEDAYGPNFVDFQSAFTTDELECLARFSEIVDRVAESTPVMLPRIDEFMSSSEWKEVSRAAGETLAKLTVRRSE